MDADGSNQTRLTNNSAKDHEPVLSPDGTKIAFYSDRDGNDEVYVMNADGSHQRNLSNNTAPGNNLGVTKYLDRFPSWSPNGTKIAFSSGRVNDAKGEGIWVMNADGSNQTELFNSAVNDTQPSWSPDGSKIVFQYGEDLYVMNADGSSPLALTSNAQNALRPEWSPDGNKIAYSDGGSCTGICIINSDGSNLTQLTTGLYPSWSPDGAKLVVALSNGIWVMNADASNKTELASEGSYPDWGPAAP